MKKIGDILQEWLDSTHLPIYQLSKRGKLSRNQIYDILTGVTKSPGVRTLDRLAAGFGLKDSAEFLNGPRPVPLSPIIEDELRAILNKIDATEKVLYLTYVPILGHGPAGEPLTIAQQPEGTVPIPTGDLGGAKRVWGLQVSGDSLIGDGIHDEDYVIIDPDAPFVDGKIYAVRLEDKRCALRHVEYVNGKMRLRSSNGNYADLEPELVEILGRVILSGRYTRH